jgi:hypothetical protein
MIQTAEPPATELHHPARRDPSPEQFSHVRSGCGW